MGPYTRFHRSTRSSGWKKLAIGLHLVAATPRRLAVPELVEGPDREMGDHAAGSIRWHRGPRVRLEREGCLTAAAGELIEVGEAAAARWSGPWMHRGHHVDPGHRVVVAVIAGLHQGQRLVEVAGAIGVHRELAGLDAVEPERGVEHDAGEAHAAGGGPEQLGSDAGVTTWQPPDGVAMVRRGHGIAPRAHLVVVLPVDVRRDRAADGHLAGPRRHRHEPAPGHQLHEQLVEAGPGGRGGQPLLLIERQQASDPGGIGHQPTGVLGWVAIGAPSPRAITPRGRSPCSTAARASRSRGAHTVAAVRRCWPHPPAAFGRSRGRDPHHEEDEPRRPGHLERAIAQHHVFGCTPVAGVPAAGRTAGSPRRTARSRSGTTGPPGRPRRPSRGPQAVAHQHHAGADRLELREVLPRVEAQGGAELRRPPRPSHRPRPGACPPP